MKKISVFLLLALLTTSLSAIVYNVSNPDEFASAGKSVQAGDSIVLSSGIWKDAQLVLKRAHGTIQHPITVTVAEPGKTFLEGTSSIRFSGEYVNVNSLVFQK